MRHYPSDRHPVRLDCLDHTPAPVACSRKTALLAAAVLFFAGFFLGAIAFGEVLVNATSRAGQNLASQTEASR